MSVTVMALAWYVADLTPAQKAVLVALADHAGDDGNRIHPSVERICIKTSYAERTVRRALAELREAGLIHIVREATHHAPTEYRIDLPQMQARQNRPAANAPHDLSEMHPYPTSDLPQIHPSSSAGVPETTAGVPENTLGVPESVVRGARNAPKPSVEPPIERPSEPSVCFVGGAPPTPTAPDLNDHDVASLVAERAGDWSRFLRSLAWVCHGHDRLDTLTKDQLGALTREAKRMFADGFRRDDLQRWLDEEWRPQWASRHAITGSYPRPLPHQVRASIPAIRASQRTFDATDTDALSPPLPAPIEAPRPAPPAETPLDSTWRAVLHEVLASQPPNSRARDWLAGSTLQEAGAVESADGRAVPLYRVRLATPEGESWIRDRLTVPIRRSLYSLLHTQVLVEVTAPELAVAA